MSSLTTRDFQAALHVVQNSGHFHQHIVDFFRRKLPAEFLASLPETFEGYTQDEYQYWLEPAAQPLRPDAKPVYFRSAYSLPDDWFANKMAPRFLNGVQLVLEEVLPGDALVEGSVYLTEMYHPLTGQREGNKLARYMSVEKHSFRIQGKLFHGLRQVVQLDNDFIPGVRIGYDYLNLPRFLDGVGAPDDIERVGFDVRMYRFLRYHSFDHLILPTKAFPRRDHAAILERQRKYDEQVARDNARRRESRARKKRTQLSGGLPGSALAFVPRQSAAA